MKIEIKQIKNTGSNEFEIRPDGKLVYVAKLPFVSIDEPFNLDKIGEIKITDINGKEIYSTDYKYIENLKEEFIPFKYLVTGSQKFNQLIFNSGQNSIKIYYEENEIWKNRYVIEINNKKFFCYSVEDGYIRHFPIYDGDLQIGEALKSNVLVDGLDEYWCYLKDEYKELGDGVIALLLYLDRNEYNSSYVVNKSYILEKSFSFNKTNKFYDKEWVKNNFGDEYYKKVDADVTFVKEKLKHPINSSKEQWNSMSEKEKKLLKFCLITPWVLVIGFGLLILILILLFGDF